MSDLELMAAEWLEVLGTEYLASFIRDGGAAVKVAVVPAPDSGAVLAGELEARAAAEGFAMVTVDAATCKVHLLHNLFFEIARQIDWQGLARAFLRSEMLAAGLALPPGGELDVETVARFNDQDVTLVRKDVRSALSRDLMRDRGLGRLFRLAVSALCKALAEPDDAQRELAENVLLWLRGELPRVGPLREAFIYQRIDRHAARTMIVSTSAFIRKAGRQGLVALVDVTRYALPVPLDDGGNRYSKSAALDMWETLRQFVDGIDDMTGGLLVFVVGRDFVTDEARGLQGYPALHLRLTDDVRDRRRANPLGAMVRIGDAREVEAG
jgi:P-loop Domain of unknown function (DUF2791)